MTSTIYAVDFETSDGQQHEGRGFTRKVNALRAARSIAKTHNVTVARVLSLAEPYAPGTVVATISGVAQPALDMKRLSRVNDQNAMTAHGWDVAQRSVEQLAEDRREHALDEADEAPAATQGASSEPDDEPPVGCDMMLGKFTTPAFTGEAAWEIWTRSIAQAPEPLTVRQITTDGRGDVVLRRLFKIDASYTSDALRAIADLLDKDDGVGESEHDADDSADAR